MFKKFVALGVAALAIPAFAATAPQAETVRFERDGHSYAYTVTDLGDARQLKGEILSTRKKFNLRVSDSGKVTGHVNGRRVSFRADVAPADAFASDARTPATAGN